MQNFIQQNISFLVSQSGLSQDDYGVLFDLKKGVVNQYRLGKSLPKLATLQRMSLHHAITLDDLVNKDLSKKEYTNPTSVNSLEEPNSGDNGDKDRIIAAQAVTIETLRKHNVTLEKLVATLEQKLSQAS